MSIPSSSSSMLYECDLEERSVTEENSCLSCDTDKVGERSTDLHSKLLEQVKQSTKMASTLEKQIAAFDDHKGGFEHWFNGKFKVALKEMRHRARREKSLDSANELKKMAEAYFKWKETEKAFDYINRAVKAIPGEESVFLGNCFTLRAEMQLITSSALSDLEKALLCRPHSYTCITRKVDILVKMKRNEEAFSFIDGILKADLRRKFTTEQVNHFHQLHADLSQYEPKPVNEEPKLTTAVPSVDKRLKMVQNVSHKRYGLFASESIASRSTVLTERPALFALKAEGRKQFCNNCWSPCKNTSWPCFECVEVIYCSQKCAEEDKAKGHSAECGLLHSLTMSSTSTVHSVMVLRFLLQHGHEKIISKMLHTGGSIDDTKEELVKQKEKKAENFKLDECFNGLSTSGSDDTVSVNQLSDWFFEQQSAFLPTFNEEKNLYSKQNALQIANSVYILSLYLHYRKLEPSSLGKATIQGLLRLLSIQLYAVALNEYSWTKKESGEKKTSNASFQCLFASSIGHSCKANAEWHFTPDGSFTLRTTASVKAGAELSISYGVTASETPCLYTRLATLSLFGRLCCCAACLADASEVFALQCLHCRGPVPWNSNSFPNDLCIVCEQKYDAIEVAKTIEQEMEATKQVICLLSVVDVLEESSNTYLELIETKLTLISEYIYPHNRGFQSVVLNLCEHYIERGKHRQAVTWFQWFVDNKDIFITCAHEANNCSTTDKKKKDDMKVVDSLLAQFYFLENWINAYLCFLELEKTSADGISMSHMNVVNKLLSQMNDIIVSWASLPPCPSSSSSCSTLLVSIGSDMKQMENHLWTLSGKHSRRYKALLSPSMESAVSQTSICSLMNAFCNDSGAAFSFDPEHQLKPTEALVQKGISGGNNCSATPQTLVDFDDELEIYVIGQDNDSESESVSTDH